MKRITKDELDIFLRKHKLWLLNDPSGEMANLRGANLREANLYGANLREANLYRADLYRADLYGANLSGANLRGANLYRADLYRADLREANLYRADLYRADLYGANLSGANLRGANLYGANLSEANLYGANLSGCKNVPPIVCPEKGSFTGFKKAGKYIVELTIPKDALRCSATSRKCRCSKAKVVSITNLDGTDSGITQVASSYDSEFIYKVGKTVKVENFDTDRWNECSAGIHFFITRQEAVDY